MISPKKEPKSLIAKLAESRKAQKSIYSFGPVAMAAVSVPAVKPAVPSTSSQSGSADLLGSILASQTQLTTFGKEPQLPRSKPRSLTSNSSRVLGAILASQATLSRLDETIKSLTQTRTSAPVRKSDRSQPTDAADQGTSTANHPTSSQGSSNSNPTSDALTNHAGRCSNGGEPSGNGLPSGNGGNGEDPDWNKMKKSDPEDKKDESAADESEDIDLYSDIESVEEEETDPVEPQLKTEEVHHWNFLKIEIKNSMNFFLISLIYL